MLEELLLFEEDFIYNKDQADINKIQELLNFSTPFGIHSYYFEEQFYTQGDEDLLIEDYKQQESGVKFFKNNKAIFDKLRDLLKTIKDLRNLYRKNYLFLDETDLFDLKQFILNFEKIKKIIDTLPFKIDLQELTLKDIIYIFDPENPDIPVFKLSRNMSAKLKQLFKELEEIDSLISKEKDLILKKLKDKGFELSFINPKIVLKSSTAYKYIKECDLIEIKEETIHYVKIEPKKTEELLKYEYRRKMIENEIIEEKEKILEKISKEVFKRRGDILLGFKYIGNLDSFLTKVDFAIRINGIVPEISYSEFSLKNGINLYLKEVVEKQGLNYTPLNISLKQGVSILTGSNMGGKTCILKTIAQIAYMVHSGLMIPAEKAIVPLFNGIFISKTADSDIAEGLSTFGFEIYSLRKVWERKNQFFLFLLDEPAKGTNPEEGRAIVKSIAYFLSKSNSFSIISTHYDRVADGIECKKFMIKGLKEKDLDKLYKLVSFDEFNVKLIHSLIDHEVIEITKETPVPKNALNILALFKFEKDFIDMCKKFISESDRIK